MCSRNRLRPKHCTRLYRYYSIKCNTRTCLRYIIILLQCRKYIGDDGIMINNVPTRKHTYIKVLMKKNMSSVDTTKLLLNRLECTRVSVLIISVS